MKFNILSLTYPVARNGDDEFDIVFAPISHT